MQCEADIPEHHTPVCLLLFLLSKFLCWKSAIPFQPSIDKRQVEELGTLAFVAREE